LGAGHFFASLFQRTICFYHGDLELPLLSQIWCEGFLWKVLWHRKEN